MAGSGYTGDPTLFAEAHKNVSQTKADMDSNLATLKANIEATREGWAGEAATVFQQVMEAFDAKTLKINEALQHIADMLQQSGVKYDTQDTDVKDQVSKLGSILNG
ncbi:WXG100 family type VII secretion target [Amycolatopsis sp. 195334CR]|uniref:WXG100 family type VII secretion target n=1 Tax=Amycolatopsis sp. 195334CR TaxID=2814588 RepID=UPI001A9050A8|nr:WXG100 family type VII secretion target [Amycolatopsis sp. 195334CR]MBN6036371.1 WXG100 family type VII secretion target [Amycolatopsis sp. 195334CR]